MRITVKYFASIREAMGQGSEVIDTAASSLGALRDELIARSDLHGQALAHSKTLRMALDQVMAGESAVLTDGAEVAFFPPVTGG
jgi:sulfur-carrier protein